MQAPDRLSRRKRTYRNHRYCRHYRPHGPASGRGGPKCRCHPRRRHQPEQARPGRPGRRLRRGHRLHPRIDRPSHRADHGSFGKSLGARHLRPVRSRRGRRGSRGRIPVVYASNFSAGVNLVLALAERMGAALPADAYDAEIVEMHHRQKVDAPSGTAVGMGRAVAKGRGVRLDEVMESGRHGHTGARKTGAIGFAALRGGQVVGEHSLIFASGTEHIASPTAPSIAAPSPPARCGPRCGPLRSRPACIP